MRLWAGWDLGEPADDQFNGGYLEGLRAEVAAFRSGGVKVLIVVHRTPAWAQRPGPALISPPVDAGEYGEFVAHMLDVVPGVGAVEVWNEPDGNLFWADGPDPAGYAALLRATYPRVKARHPGVTVTTGGLVANDFGYLADLYANGAQGSFDAVAVHTDTPCLLAPPDFYYRERDGRIGRFTFTGYREVHHVMQRERRITVTKVAPGELARVDTDTTLRVRARRGLRIVVSGAVSRPPGPLPMRGHLWVHFQRREAVRRGKRVVRRVWKRRHIASTPVRRRFRLAVTLPAGGAWRAQARFRGKPPYGGSVSSFERFRLRR